MKLVMFLLIIVGLLLLYLRKKNNVYNIVLIIYMCVLFMFGVNNTDSYAYMTLFNDVCRGGNVYDNQFGIDSGFVFIMKMFSIFTEDYHVFRLIVILIAFYFIIISLKKIDEKNSMILVLYFLFPFGYDAIQIAFFLAYTIVVYICVCVIKEECSLSKFILFGVIACSIHKSILILTIYILLLINGKKINLKKWEKILLGVLFLLFVINVYFKVNFVQMIVDLLPYVQGYVGGYVERKEINPMHHLLIFLMYFLIVLYSYKIKNDSSENKKLHDFNCISLILLPTIFTTLDFERLLRPMLMINYIYIHSTATLQRKDLRYLEFFIVLIVIVRYSSYYEFYVNFIESFVKWTLG